MTENTIQLGGHVRSPRVPLPAAAGPGFVPAVAGQTADNASEGMEVEQQLALMGITLEGVMAELRYRRAQKIAEAYRVQRLAAKVNGERRTLHTAEGGGEVQMQIHPVFYHYWGQRLGYDCWKDPQFNREILRDNPEVRIKNHVRAGAETRAMAANRSTGSRPAAAPVRGKRGRWAA